MLVDCGIIFKRIMENIVFMKMLNCVYIIFFEFGNIWDILFVIIFLIKDFIVCFVVNILFRDVVLLWLKFEKWKYFEKYVVGVYVL